LEREMNRPDLLRRQKPAPAPRQRRSRRRRDAILRAAIARFGRDGYEGASIREIARDAGVALGAVSQFFRSKRLLLLTSMDTLLRHLEAFGPPSFADLSTVERDLEKFLREVFARERPFIGVYRAWQEAALIDSMIAAYDRQIRTWTRWRIHALFSLLTRVPG